MDDVWMRMRMGMAMGNVGKGGGMAMRTLGVGWWVRFMEKVQERCGVKVSCVKGTIVDERMLRLHKPLC